MDYINGLLSELSARLPELEWKVSALSAPISSYCLPPGLFRTNLDPNGTACIAEIKADIRALSLQKNERSAVYLAERISQKIKVLVALCQIHSRKKQPEEKKYFGIKMLSTRQQWISALEADIDILSQQQQAMIKTLEQMMRSDHGAATLQLRSELGEVVRRLTLAKEELNRAIS